MDEEAKKWLKEGINVEHYFRKIKEILRGKPMIVHLKHIFQTRLDVNISESLCMSSTITNLKVIN